MKYLILGLVTLALSSLAWAQSAPQPQPAPTDPTTQPAPTPAPTPAPAPSDQTTQPAPTPAPAPVPAPAAQPTLVCSTGELHDGRVYNVAIMESDLGDQSAEIGSVSITVTGERLDQQATLGDFAVNINRDDARHTVYKSHYRDFKLSIRNRPLSGDEVRSGDKVIADPADETNPDQGMTYLGHLKMQGLGGKISKRVICK